MDINNYLIFETESGNKYIYDNSTSYVTPYDELLIYFIENSKKNLGKIDFEKLQNQFNLDLSHVENKYKSFKKMKDMGYFSNSSDFKQIEKRDFFEMVYDSPTSQLLLIITNNCNMRCVYCVYSEMYPNTIPYKDKQMSFDVAVKAIEQYMRLHQIRERKGLNKNPVINFYGGEPLLNFELIKKVVNYCSTNYTHKFDYYVTTNGLLLQDNVIEFLVKNDFRVTISLDGDAENHDRNRLKHGGGNTHSEILKNIKKYFKIKESLQITGGAISFNACFDSYTSPTKMLKFFEEDEFLKDKDIFVFYSEIIPYGTEYYDYCKNLNKKGIISNSQNTWSKELKQIQKDFLKDLEDKNEISPYIKSLFTSFFFYGNRKVGTQGPLNHSCIPGSKIAVNADGDFFLCERVCEKLPIGNVENGLMWEKIEIILEQFLEILNEHCAKCNISKMCQLCFMHLGFESQDKLEFNEKFCDQTKEYVPALLSKLYGTIEKNNLAFREEDTYETDF